MPLNALIPAFSIPSTLPLAVCASKKIWPAPPVPRPVAGGAACATASAAPSAPAANPAAAMTSRRLTLPI